MTAGPTRLSLSTFRRRLAGYDHLLLMSDYDGTLVAIRKHPAQAVASRSLRELLQRLANSQGMTLAIISGRSLREIRRLLPLRRIIRAGNHGFEISGLGMRIVIHIPPVARNALQEVGNLLRQRLGKIPGCLVEEKGVTVSIHYRRVPAQHVHQVRQNVRAVAEPYLRQKVLRLTRGKKVLELRPPIEWDKGKAVEAICRHVAQRAGSRRVLPVYCGDDVTDEDAFRALRHRGVTVRVGRARQTAARYYMPSPEEMVRFLKALSCLDWHARKAS